MTPTTFSACYELYMQRCVLCHETCMWESSATVLPRQQSMANGKAING